MANNTPKNPEVRRLRARIAGIVRLGGDPVVLEQTRRELKVEMMKDAITELVNSAPLPTREQRDELISLLRTKPKGKRNAA